MFQVQAMLTRGNEVLCRAAALIHARAATSARSASARCASKEGDVRTLSVYVDEFCDRNSGLILLITLQCFCRFSYIHDFRRDGV